MHGFAAHYYHAGLSAEERDQKQQGWINNKVQVMVCTNAFGMGIDKPDVRLVIHADMPDCLENYYQEAGRAGRDGKKSFAVLLYTPADIENLQELHKTRYLTLEQIRQVYQSLVNYLQIPSYSGDDLRFTLDFTEFVRNFQLNSQVALYALKALESEDWLVFNEKSFIPSTLVFTTGKQQLYDFQRNYPQFEPLLTTLLRAYEGIFDYPVFINEKNIAYLLRKTADDVKQLLHAVMALGIIRYTPQNDAPQIIFKKHRVRAEDFFLDLSQHEKRKAVFMERIEQMIRYTEISTCRSQYINTYFGDAETKACGICDNCLKAKATSLTKEEFAQIHQQITMVLQGGRLLPEQLVQQLGVSKEKAWQVVTFLQAERKLNMDKSGQLFIVS